MFLKPPRGKASNFNKAFSGERTMNTYKTKRTKFDLKKNK